ncbi:MAG TPA: ornithine carbamoyltransferase, partial [Urbifossiella sp.]|nr:ornithine carbamoyltransferase [Urbifossiella sp.]
MKHFLNVVDWTRDELCGLLTDAARLKAAHARGVPARSLAGKVVGLVFEKPSLRTRVSFESGVAQLGGTALYLPGNEVGLGWRETHADFARTIGQYIDALVLRVFHHDTVAGVAKASTIPIINGLSDRSHPCQALADLLTIQEHLGGLAGRTLAYLGDGNNVCHSLLLGGAAVGLRVKVATPSGYEPDARIVDEARLLAREHGGAIEIGHDPMAATREADAVYTDVWASMGFEGEAAER